jgi:hypothetical protein
MRSTKGKSMGASRLSIEPKRWFAWDTLSAHAFEGTWPSTPIFVTAVKPLKSGKGILRIFFVAALHPISPKKFTIDLRIVHHRPDHLVGIFFDGDGREHTASVSTPTFEWLQFRCLDFASRFPASNFERTDFVLIDPETGAEIDPGNECGIEDYLTSAFGADEENIITGVNEHSFRVKLLPLPKARAVLPFEHTFTPMQSFLLGRGFVPKVMEEKWFIYMKEGHLVFRRSWTGMYIYRVMLERRGNQIHTNHAIVNRNKEQYSEVDDVYDKKLLEYLIYSILLGEPRQFPTKAE